MPLSVAGREVAAYSARMNSCACLGSYPDKGSSTKGAVTVQVVFETHSSSVDNERGIATGWLPGRLSEAGREQARALGKRRRHDGLSAVFTSDLRRAVETVEIAFEGVEIPVFHDWRLRECNYGRLNGCPAAEVHGDRRRYLDEPYPGGESWRQAVQRVGRVFEDLKDASFDRVLIVGHIATHWACDHLLAGVSLEDLAAAEFTWREGWEYDLGALTAG